MDTWNLLWLLLIFLAFVPTIQQKLLKLRRQHQISTIEQERDSRVILLVHRQEAMRFFGFPLMRYIDMNDSEEVLRAIKMTDDDVPIDLVLHTPGGLVLASLQIARAIKHHPADVTVFVPHMAMSGGTLIALAADDIVMSDHASLGPVDPQIQQSPAASVLNVVQNKPIGEIEDQTLIHADVAHKATLQLRIAVKNLLEGTLEAERAEEVADLLSRGAWTHDYPLNVETLTELDLPVTTEMPENIYDLLSLYPQPMRQSSNVEYIPTPHKGKNTRRNSPDFT